MYSCTPVKRAPTDLLRAARIIGLPRSSGAHKPAQCRLLTTFPRHMTASRYKAPATHASATSRYRTSTLASAISARSPSILARTYASNAMSEIKVKVGDTIPQGTFTYIPYAPELEDHSACGIPVKLNTDEWKGKKVVLVSVPGAFTPTCHANHVPPFLEKYDEFKKKGVDVVAIIAANDAFVLSGWARFLGLKDKVLVLSDPNARWSAQLGLSQDLSAVDFGTRTKRYALVIDDLKVKYVGVEPERGVTVSGADAVLAAL